jgi:hypothetical protein
MQLHMHLVDKWTLLLVCSIKADRERSNVDRVRSLPVYEAEGSDSATSCMLVDSATSYS